MEANKRNLNKNSGEINRAFEVRRDSDSFTVPSITPYDVDFAVLYQLNQEIIPQIMENGELISVPISFAFGDTPSQIQRYGYVVDKHEKAITPLISLQRTGYSKNNENPLANTPVNIFEGPIIRPKVQHNSQHDRVDETILSGDSVEFYIINNPKYRVLTYNVNIWTSDMMQMNKIISAIDMFDNTMWGDAFKFRTKIGDFNFDTKNTLNERRIVRATTSLEVRAALTEEYIGKSENLRKSFSLKRVDFSVEIEDDTHVIEKQHVIKPDATYIETLRRDKNG